MKKKVKHRLIGKRRPGRTGANLGGERTDSTSSLPQLGPHVVAGEGYDREGDRANAAGERVFSTDLPPQSAEPESVPARENDNGQEEAGVDGKEASQRHSYPHPDVEVAVGSGRSGELEGVHPSPSTPSISHGGKPDSM